MLVSRKEFLALIGRRTRRRQLRAQGGIGVFEFLKKGGTALDGRFPTERYCDEQLCYIDRIVQSAVRLSVRRSKHWRSAGLIQPTYISLDVWHSLLSCAAHFRDHCFELWLHNYTRSGRSISHFVVD